MILDLVRPISDSDPIAYDPLPRPTPAVAPAVTPPAVTDSVRRTVPQGPVPAGPLFAAIPTADSVVTAEAHLADRQAAVVAALAKAPVGEFPLVASEPVIGPHKPGRRGFPLIAAAKLTLGQDAEAINRVLLSSKPYSGVGTHFEILPHVGLHGDYDFTLTELIPLAYRFDQSPLLKPETRQHLASVLLNQEGGGHAPTSHILGIVPESENHILMTESARYLKNQLVQRHGAAYSTDRLPAEAYDNRKNGFNAWFLAKLSGFTRQDFDEYNSKPYQTYSVRAIQNMADFAEDPDVKLSARIVLDYLAVRFAVQSDDLRRVVPFRRRPEFAKVASVFENDFQAARYALLAGNYGRSVGAFGNSRLSLEHMMFTAQSDYRVPGAILDLMIDKSHNPYFGAVHHHNTEITDAEAHFVISAGGRYQDWSKLPFTDQENGVVEPTVVMLNGGSDRPDSMIRFLGRGDGGPANNTGVYGNFACGIRPTLPAGMEATAKAQGKLIQDGAWTFLELDHVYVVLHRQSQKSPSDYAPSVGFLEVVDKSESPSLKDLHDKVMVANATRTYQAYGPNRYTTSRGRTIEFVMADPLEGLFDCPPKPDKVDQWAIRRVWDGQREIPLETNLDRWPLMDVKGQDPAKTLVRADGTGQVLIDNPHQQQSLILSLADQRKPIRIEQAGPLVNLAESARIAGKGDAAAVDLTVSLPQAEAVRYLSLPWTAGSKPSRITVYVQRAGSTAWETVEQRPDPFHADGHAFRTDFDLAGRPSVTAVRFVAAGTALSLSGQPEIYRAG